LNYKAGDVLASVIDFDAGSVSFYVNGNMVGNAPAFEGVESDRPVYPTVVLAAFQKAALNFGQLPFKVCCFSVP